mgnify:CR=1 FL=1
MGYPLDRPVARSAVSAESRLSTGRLIIDNIRILCAAVLAGASFTAAAQSDAPPDAHWHAAAQLGSVHDNGRSDGALQIGFAYDLHPFGRTTLVAIALTCTCFAIVPAVVVV